MPTPEALGKLAGDSRTERRPLSALLILARTHPVVRRSSPQTDSSLRAMTKQAVATQLPTATDPYVITREAVEAPPTSLGFRLATHRSRDGARGVDRRIGRAHRDDDARSAGRFRGVVDHPRQLRDQARRPGRARALHHRDGRYRRSRRSTGCPGPRLGVSWLVWAWALTVSLTLLQIGGMYGGVSQVLHVARAGRPGHRVGWRLPGHHHRRPARRRLRAHREAGDRQGRIVHRADRLRGRRPPASIGRRVGQRSRRRPQPFSFPPPAWRRPSRSSASPASAPPSS